MSGWSVLYDLADNDVHVVPDDDLIGHQLDADCVCSPSPELVQRGDGGDGWVVVHHSLDGREQGEGEGT
jgi:hypothetical protein